MNSAKIGILSFLFVLFVIPLGHALMVLAENVFPEYKMLSAGILGFMGIIMLIQGMKSGIRPIAATIWGFMGGIFTWTGWVEFSFVWIAEKLNVAPLMENGEVSTKPEYLVMMSSLGLLGVMLFYGLLSKSNCLFYRWFQKIFRIKKFISGSYKKPLALTTFFETIMIVWSFYVLLLLVYDEEIAGTYHPATYIVGFGSLLWSLFLIRNLLSIQVPDLAVRYAIPTVVIFWNFIEVMGRWNFFTEIWIDPFGHALENLAILVIFILFLIFMNRVKKPVFKGYKS